LVKTVSFLSAEQTGIVSCPYQLAKPQTAAMHCEAVAINADFWSQVLQSNTLKPMDFALGAVMLMRREALDASGGFTAIADCLADDYQLGHRIVKAGWRSVLCPVVVECWDPPQGWIEVWKHQLRWARTIRVCQPVPYFFSILSNAAVWPLLWLVVGPRPWVTWTVAALILLRVVLALDLQSRLTRSRGHLMWFWMVPVKDLLHVVVWIGAFLGSTVEWRGRRMLLRRDGTMG
jgi:ceramide glucosyltransferase